MEVSVLNIKGQETGRKVTLNEAIFGIEPNDHVIYLDVKQYLANQRQGTAKSKERSEISGSTRKLGRQKGGRGALARKSVLSYKAQDNAIVVVEDFTLSAPKTKELVAIEKNLKVDGKKVLFLMPNSNSNLYLSARNLQGSEVLEASKLNAYKVLNADVLVVTEQSLQTIDGILNK